MPDLAENSEFPLTEARELVKDLSRPKPHIYWLDFAFHISLGWGAFVLAVLSPDFSALQIGATLVAALALYRAVIFTHELAHLKKGTFRLFRFVWNLLCGLPMLVPSFTYHGIHNDHHARDIYGTKEDGEYLPFGADNPWKIVGYLFLIFLLPLIFVLRFLILAPLSWLLPGLLRPLIWRRMSSLAIDLSYERPDFSRRDDPSWQWQEFFAFLYGWTLLVMVLGGTLPLEVLLLWYVVTILIFLLNSLRTLAAHAYRNPGDKTMSVAEQFLDSVDVPGNFLTTLWAPVGLRYHATHHLFPSMPYHALGAANRRLRANLGDNSLYLKADRKSLFHALVRLWQDARRSRQRDKASGLAA